VIRVLVLYPRSEGSTFDGDYYVKTHMPLVAAKWPSVTGWQADLGGPDQTYHCVGHIHFDSAEALGEAMGSPSTGEVMADVANFTNVQPQLFVGEVVGTS
jgi:uncharacterized protein (TIGR02118 family)